MNKDKLTRKFINTINKLRSMDYITQSERNNNTLPPDYVNEKLFKKIKKCRESILLLARKGIDWSAREINFHCILSNGYNLYKMRGGHAGKNVDAELFDYVRELTEAGLPIECCKSDIKELIFRAIEQHNTGFVKYIVSHGFDLKDRHYTTNLLGLTIKNRNFDLFKYLIESGIDINNEDHITPNNMYGGNYSGFSPLVVAELCALSENNESDEYVAYLKGKNAKIIFYGYPQEDLGYQLGRISDYRISPNDKEQDIYKQTKNYIIYTLENMSYENMVDNSKPTIMASGKYGNVLLKVRKLGDEDLIKCAEKYISEDYTFIDVSVKPTKKVNSMGEDIPKKQFAKKEIETEVVEKSIEKRME